MSTGEYGNASGVKVFDGDASGIRHNPSFAVTDTGSQIDLADLGLQYSGKNSKSIAIFNKSEEIVKMAFDKDGSEITFSDLPFLPGTSWNVELGKKSDPNANPDFAGNFSASKIGFRTDTGKVATLDIMLV